MSLVLGFLLGLAVAAGAAYLNHWFSTRQHDREARRTQALFWNQWADEYIALVWKSDHLVRPVAASTIPDDPEEVVNAMRAEMLQSKLNWRQYAERYAGHLTLTDHVRLLLDRLARAGKATPLDWQLINLSQEEFRSAVDHYVRTGTRLGLRLLPDDSPDF